MENLFELLLELVMDCGLVRCIDSSADTPSPSPSPSRLSDSSSRSDPWSGRSGHCPLPERGGDVPVALSQGDEDIAAPFPFANGGSVKTRHP